MTTVRVRVIIDSLEHDHVRRTVGDVLELEHRAAAALAALGAVEILATEAGTVEVEVDPPRGDGDRRYRARRGR